MNGDTLEMALEQILDNSKLNDMLAALANVCDAKAEHLASNWQDAVSAKAWTMAATRVREVSQNPKVVAVSI
jgi:hypothetical protein